MKEQSRIPERLQERRVGSLQIGEVGYVSSSSIDADEKGYLWIHHHAYLFTSMHSITYRVKIKRVRVDLIDVEMHELQTESIPRRWAAGRKWLYSPVRLVKEIEEATE